MADRSTPCNILDMNALPNQFPTHQHEPGFWESLGRAVATFGFLEETLSKAIYAFTATRPYNEAEIEQAYAEWLPKLEHALIDPLGCLIDTYGKAVHDHPEAKIEHFDEFLGDLRKASEIRNILCHGSWRLPDANGASLPLFVNRQKMVVTRAMDHHFINQVQQHAAELACTVVNSVTHMGWQFPGSSGPGTKIW